MSDSDVLKSNDAPVDLVPVEQHVCPVCRLPFPFTYEYFSPTKTMRVDGTYRHGFVSRCRACERTRGALLKKKNWANIDWIEEAAEKGLKLWERQPSESIEAFEAFVVFRAMYIPGTRRASIAMVAEKAGKGFASVAHHAGNWKWQLRLDAYIAELDKTRLAMEEEARREMLTRHVQTAVDLQKKATERLATLTIDDLSAKEVIQYIDTAIKIERQARQDAMSGTVHEASESSNVQNVQININTDQNQSNLAGILSILERSGALATVMGDKKAPIVDIFPEDEDGAE